MRYKQDSLLDKKFEALSNSTRLAIIDLLNGSSHIRVNCWLSDKRRGFPDGRLGSENNWCSVNSFFASANGMVCQL